MALLDGVRSVYCLGIGGIGVSAIAKFCNARGIAVAGADAVASNITADVAVLGIPVTIGEGSLPQGCDLLVYTEAAGEEHPVRQEALRRGIRQLGHFGFLGELSKEYRTICITGTNGKSTTTAMTGEIFAAAGLDPTVFVGSVVPGWELGNLRIGRSNILIVEGDEYKRKVLALHPETTLITNIEKDHLDVYRDLADIEEMFAQLCQQTSKSVVQSVLKIEHPIYHGGGAAGFHFFGFECTATSWGKIKFRPRRFINELQILDLTVGQGFLRRRKKIGELRLRIPGVFNMMNACAARYLGWLYGISDEIILPTLEQFSGIWRRFERVGEYHGATIISDYGHHPTAVRGTLDAARELFPGRRIVLAFQPHQHNRTKELFDDFAAALAGADALVLCEIYAVAGRMADADDVSSKQLLVAVGEQSRHPAVREYAADPKAAEEQLRALIAPGDVVLVMGAGDIDGVARRLVAGA